MDIKNLTGLEKPLTKLIEVISKGTGVLYEPTRIKKVALAEAESLKIKSDAIVEVLEKHGKAGALALVCEKEKLEFKDVSDLSDRLIESKHYQERLEQRNVENVIASSIEYMGDQVSDEEVDIDWRTRFFKKARDISHVEMQKVWGKILAGEVSKPGSFSVRTLELLSNLNQQEAELFRKVSSYVCMDNGCIFLRQRKRGGSGFSDLISYKDLLDLKDCGVLLSSEFMTLTFELEAKEEDALIYKNGRMIFTNLSDRKIQVSTDIICLSKSARELLPLVETDYWDHEYFSLLRDLYPALNIRF